MLSEERNIQYLRSQYVVPLRDSRYVLRNDYLGTTPYHALVTQVQYGVVPR